jgi:hypothetical protein
MSQLFPRSANAIARMSLAGVLAVALTGGWVVFTLMRSGWATKQHEIVEQPVQFSHAHHVGGVGLDCRYCHTSVENSSFAGIPPTKTCMNCHSQVWANAPILEPVRASLQNNTNLSWIRVHDLPDYVYFNHQIHVRQGVGCATCHGQVDQMPLMYQEQSLLMEWCLNCHRAPEKFLRPRDQVFNMNYVPDAEVGQDAIGARLKQEYNVASVEHLTSCSTCHR